MSALIWCAIGAGYVFGVLGGVAVLLWLGAKEGYTRGYVRIVGTAQAKLVEDDDE